MAVTAKESLDHAGKRLADLSWSLERLRRAPSEEELGCVVSIVQELSIVVGYLHDAIRKTREEHSLGF